MKKISSNDKGIATMFLVIIVVVVIAVAAVGAYFVLAGDDDNNNSSNDNSNDNSKNETTVAVNFSVSVIINTGETIDIYIDDVKVKTISGVSGALTNSPFGSEQYKFTGTSKEITVSAKLMRSNGTDVVQTTSMKIMVTSETASYDANIVFSYTDLKITVGASLAADATLKVYVGSNYLAATLDYISPGPTSYPVIDVGKIALSDDQNTVTVRIVAIDSNDFEKTETVTKDIVKNGTTNVSIAIS